MDSGLVMSLYSMIIAGCARNCGKWLPAVWRNIELIKEHFHISDVIIAYDSSEDDTLAQLRVWNVTILEGVGLSLREESLAAARNRLVEHINKAYPDEELVIMMDLDDVCSGNMDIQVLREALESQEEWDAVSFWKEPYEDFWALSFGDWEFSIWHHRHPLALMENMRADLANLVKAPGRWIDVTSAFGGFAIYKWPLFSQNRYNHRIDYGLFDRTKTARIVNRFKAPLMPREFHDCEHRSFHITAVRAGAKIRILKAILFNRTL
jgi:hypothetical protein